MQRARLYSMQNARHHTAALRRHIIGSLDDFPPPAPGFGRVERAAQAEMEEVLFEDILRHLGLTEEENSGK